MHSPPYELAQVAADSEFIYPLTEETVVDVAAAVKAAHYRSAVSYLGELRLGHIESRHDVPLWLARVFAGCRRALLRGLGPPSRAVELPVELVGEETFRQVEKAIMMHTVDTCWQEHLYEMDELKEGVGFVGV